MVIYMGQFSWDGITDIGREMRSLGWEQTSMWQVVQSIKTGQILSEKGRANQHTSQFRASSRQMLHNASRRSSKQAWEEIL